MLAAAAVLVVIYCRVSSEEQALKDISIPAQRKALRRWAEQQGFTILREFADEGESAYLPANKRPGFTEMISFCRKNKMRFILVHKLDRFSRDREESIIYKSLLRKHNVLVKSITETYDPETPSGFLYEGMIEVINQFYSMNLATETIKGMRENAERGYHNGGRTPFGYRLETFTDAGRERTRLAPGADEDVAVLQEMFRLAVEEGMGCKSIANELNRRQIPAPRSQGWSGTTIASILMNPVYVGDLVWRRRKTVDRTRRQVTSAEEQVVTREAHKPLISRELFEQRAALASKRSFHAPKAKEGPAFYLLGRVIRCGKCGQTFIGRSQKYSTLAGEERRRSAYYCNGYMSKGSSICQSFPLDTAWADGEVISAIRSRVCKSEGLAELEQIIRERVEFRQKELDLNPDLVRRKLEEVDRRIANYYKAIGDGLDPAVCRQHIEELSARKTVLERESELLRVEDYHQRALNSSVAGLRRFAKAFEGNFQKLPFGIRRQIVLYFTDQVEVIDRKMLRITLQVPSDDHGVKLLTEDLESGGDSIARSADDTSGSMALSNGGGDTGRGAIFARPQKQNLLTWVIEEELPPHPGFGLKRHGLPDEALRR